MRKLIIILVMLIILCGGCKPKEEIILTIPETNVKIAMRLIPAGQFVMGSPQLEVDRSEDEGPQHLVTITEPFYIGVYEVTQEQWLTVMGTLPSYFGYYPGSPVEFVSWDDCQEFITELNTKGIGKFRLPTEAEWEYACRAESVTSFSYGDDATYSDINEYAWHLKNSESTTHTVGQLKPNAWGLFDTHGNVLEWCSDWYGTYNDTPQTDPEGPENGTYRVLRGGAWSFEPRYLRTARRGYHPQWDSNASHGFRLVRTTK